MSTAASVLVCVLSVLGRSERTLPPIELVDIAPPDITLGAEAWVRADTGRIYLLTSSYVFREAAMRTKDRCHATLAVKKLASILVHEEWHLKHGNDERKAYYAQLTALLALGVQDDSPLFHSVRKSMNVVLRARERVTRRLEAVVAERR